MEICRRWKRNGADGYYWMIIKKWVHVKILVAIYQIKSLAFWQISEMYLLSSALSEKRP